MPSDALHLKDYRFTSDDELFLDANVWLLIHGPQKPGRDARTDNYSTAFRRMLEAGSRIYIDVVVLSEIINRWARFHYQESDCAPKMSFKAFRNSTCLQIGRPGHCRRYPAHTDAMFAHGKLLHCIGHGHLDGRIWERRH